MYVILMQIQIVPSQVRPSARAKPLVVDEAPKVQISSVPALPEVITKLLYMVLKREGFTYEELPRDAYFKKEPVSVSKTHKKGGRKIRYPSTLPFDVMEPYLTATLQAVVITTLESSGLSLHSVTSSNVTYSRNLGGGVYVPKRGFWIYMTPTPDFHFNQKPDAQAIGAPKKASAPKKKASDSKKASKKVSKKVSKKKSGKKSDAAAGADAGDDIMMVLGQAVDMSTADARLRNQRDLIEMAMEIVSMAMNGSEDLPSACSDDDEDHDDGHDDDNDSDDDDFECDYTGTDDCSVFSSDDEGSSYSSTT